ncbi:MAG: hypothetical protein AB1758_23840 [Candidatus Eremiobacterota bacterium]
MQTILRVSSPGNETSRSPSISGDGRFVAFSSLADNLVEGDTNDKMDIFVYDRSDGRIECLTRGADGHSFTPVLSANGRFVAFVSQATNLVEGDTNGHEDVFVHDRKTGTTWRASVDSQGRQAEGRSGSPSLSADGRYVAFESSAENLVSGDTNGARDIFLRDNWLQETTRASLGAEGVQADADCSSPSLCADGSRVAFQSEATNLGCENYETNVYVRDLRGGRTLAASLTGEGGPANGRSYHPVLSGDGRKLAFETTSTNLVTGGSRGMGDVVVRDLDSGRMYLASAPGDRASGNASLSHDGGVVAFDSFAANLTPGDTNGESDIFVRHLESGSTVRVGGSAGSYLPALSADGKSVAFMSLASDLGPPDDNSTWDVYLAEARAYPDDDETWDGCVPPATVERPTWFLR